MSYVSKIICLFKIQQKIPLLLEDLNPVIYNLNQKQFLIIMEWSNILKENKNGSLLMDIKKMMVKMIKMKKMIICAEVPMEHGCKWNQSRIII